MNEINFFFFLIRLNREFPQSKKLIGREATESAISWFSSVISPVNLSGGPASRTATEIFYWGYVLMLSQS